MQSYSSSKCIIYRDLKPENILIQSSVHVALTNFDLSCLTSCKPQARIWSLKPARRRVAAAEPSLQLLAILCDHFGSYFWWGAGFLGSIFKLEWTVVDGFRRLSMVAASTAQSAATVVQVGTKDLTSNV